MEAGRAPAPTLGESLRRQWARLDMVSCIAAASLQTLMLVRASSIKGCAAEAFNFMQVLALLALHSNGAAERLRQRYPVLRTLLVLGIRGVGNMLVPNTMDILGAMQPDLHPPTGLKAASFRSIMAEHSPTAVLAVLGSYLRSLILLALAVCWVHACIGSAIGWQLPPVLHALHHTTCVATLFWRAPRVCKQFVEHHPHNARVAAGVYWLLQQIASFLCLGSREHLAAVAQASNECQKCVAVAWAVQLSLGLVLPTLMVWTAQLSAAQEWATRQHAAPQQQEQQGGSGAQAVDMARQADKLVVQQSQWGRVCQPVLHAAAECPGGWLVVVPLTALLGFVVAVVSLPHVADGSG